MLWNPTARDIRLAPNGVILTLMGQIRTFAGQITVHLAHRSEKVPALSNFGSNLTHFGTKPTISAPQFTVLVSEYLEQVVNLPAGL